MLLSVSCCCSWLYPREEGVGVVRVAPVVEADAYKIHVGLRLRLDVVDAVRRGDVEVVDGWQENWVVLHVQPLEPGLIFAEEAISSIACNDGAGQERSLVTHVWLYVHFGTKCKKCKTLPFSPLTAFSCTYVALPLVVRRNNLRAICHLRLQASGRIRRTIRRFSLP
jgi:hypothetical protein